jgi:hypothetical protein
MNQEADPSPASDLDSDHSSVDAAPVEQPSGWIRVGAVAAASALLGGLAAAWWYRKTLKKLRESGESAENPEFGISDDPLSAEEAPFDI